jgi:two-component system sensor histidine kinase RegB
VDLAALLDEVRSRLAPDAAQRLVIRSLPDLTPVLVPRAGLSQTLLSLVMNAIDATADDDTPVLVEVVSGRDAVTVSVVDQGPGLSADAQRHAGEPFYTTKEPGRGLGLGLFLARAFAERVGGSLTIESAGGTTATLELPLKVA